MKYLKKFSTDTDRIAYESGSNYIEPYVSLVSEDSSVHYNRVPLNYLRFTALEDGSTLQLKKCDGDSGEELIPTINIECSWDGFNFITYDYTLLEFSEGQTIYLRGNNSNGFSIFDEEGGTWIWHYFVTPEGSFECHGNIMSLIYGADFETSPNALVIPDNCQLHALFYNGSDDEGCNITTAPELPATKLQPDCYSHMFQGCENLATAPELPATTLEKNCYYGMFYLCTSLTLSPELPATTLTEWCYAYMFYGCTSLTTAPQLPATTLENCCYYYMFYNCTSLTTAPELPATTLARSCYMGMFEYCTSLNYIKAMFTTTPSNVYTLSWVEGVAATGTFVKSPVAVWDVTGYNGVPRGWNVEAMADEYFTTIAREDGTISFNIWKNMGTEYITSMSYSTDNGETWVTTPNQNNKSEHLVITVNVSEGDKVLWKGSASQLGYYDEDDYGDAVGSFFSSTCEFDAQGNVMSLLYGDNYKNQMTIEETYAFAWLFSDYDEEKTCGVVNAKDLSLPATTLTNSCYYGMFDNCTSLTTVPELPATTLAVGCYWNMFNGCTSLTTAPKLPATILAPYCYQQMFIDCTSLTTTPELPATTLTEYCYDSMFQGCTNLTTAPDLSATTLASYCYQNMFKGCTNLTTAPELPATTLADWCYSYMFYGCSSLTTAPELPATTLAEACYAGMFNGCTNLTTAPELPATTLANSCYSYMFRGCTCLTTAPELPATTLANSCYENMFSGCTSLTTAPELPATTLAGRCYYSMFPGCSSLNYIKAMFTTTPGIGYTNNWVNGVAASGTFVKNAAATWTTTGNSGVPTGWEVRTASE